MARSNINSITVAPPSFPRPCRGPRRDEDTEGTERLLELLRVRMVLLVDEENRLDESMRALAEVITAAGQTGVVQRANAPPPPIPPFTGARRNDGGRGARAVRLRVGRGAARAAPILAVAPHCALRARGVDGGPG